MNIDTEKLSGRYVYLEKLTATHREPLRGLAKDERIWEFTRRFKIDEAYNKQFDQYFDSAIDNNQLGGQQAFVIYTGGSNEIIGMTRFYEIEKKDKRISIGWTWYTPAVWGKVFNKECKLLLLQYAFEELSFNRVEFTVAHQNIRSQKAVEKIGGIKEGVQRKYGYRNDGSLMDRVVFSIIDDDWPVVKQKLNKMIHDSENV